MQQVIPKFPKYEILGEIGHGGMGVVYKARHTGLDKLRAIKIIIPTYATDREFITRFNLEARRAASVEHPNVVRIVDEGATEDGIPYTIMEYVEGISLEKKIRDDGCLDVDAAVAIIAQVADALDHIHECGLVHRDVKSANILVTPRGRAVLTDFGIAHLITDTRITKTGLVIGTPEFMSPEQINGAKNIDGRSDIFSLGVVLYNILTCQLPFAGETPIATGVKITRDPHLPIRQFRDVPEWLDSVVEGCLQKEPETRVQTGKELAAMLREHRTWSPGPLRETQTTERITTDTFKALKIDNKKTVERRPGGKVEQGQLWQSPKRKILLGITVVAFIAGALVIPKLITNETEQQTARTNQETGEKVPAATQVIVPDVSGQTLEEARRLLEQAGFRVGEVRGASFRVEDIGKVVKQKPKASQEVERNTTVDLTIGE
jgi:serine/threonine-protein kinase